MLALHPSGVIPALATIVLGLALLVPAIVIFLLSVREGYDEAERRDRRANGRCLGCGYRLKGNVTGICPECGMEIGSPKISPIDRADARN